MKTYKYDIRLDEDRLPILVKECTVFYRQRMTHLCPDAVADWLRERLGMGSMAREGVAVLVYDSAGVLIGVGTPSVGTVSMSLIAASDVFQLALALGGTGVIVAHNHPSGDPTPSAKDLDTMERIRLAGELMGIPLIDFIIVGIPFRRNKGYWSALENDLVGKEKEEP